ncbi:MAG: glycosyltransferase family 87 protein [Chloroflexota bacterium]|nr:glycosyltransferase family 87 protein [Chloroflexota bacterium]
MRARRRTTNLVASLSTLAQTRWLRWLLVAALVVLYAGWLAYVIQADRPLDFYVYYMAAEIIARGDSPYTISDPAWDALASDLDITNYTRPYRYPPYTATLLTLFRPLGPRWTMVMWLVANAAAMIGGAWLLGQALGSGWWLSVSLAALLLFVPPLATLMAGQVNGLLFFCLALALWWMTRQQERGVGVGLALGTALKVIPLALVLYLFWRRRWRAGLTATGVLLILTLVCLPVVGWEGLADYGERAILLGRPGDVDISPTNQTITAVLGRAFPATSPLALASGRWLGLLLVILTAALCWPVDDTARWMGLEFGLIVAALQLLPPFTWYHQLVLLLIPMLVVANQLWITRRWGWLALLVALFVLTDVHGLAWHYLADWPWLTSFPFMLGLMLWGLSGWLLVRRKWHAAL